MPTPAMPDPLDQPLFNGAQQWLRAPGLAAPIRMPAAPYTNAGEGAAYPIPVAPPAAGAMPVQPPAQTLRVGGGFMSRLYGALMPAPQWTQQAMPVAPLPNDAGFSMYYAAPRFSTIYNEGSRAAAPLRT